MRRPGTICRLSVAFPTQSVFCLSAADPCSLCTHTTAGYSAWTWHGSSDGMLHARRRTTVPQYPECDPLLRPALGRRDGHLVERDFNRAAALSRQTGL